MNLTPFRQVAFFYSLLTLAGIAAGVALIVHPVQFFINPLSFFLQAMPLAGMLIAFLMPDEFLPFIRAMAKRLREHSKLAVTLIIFLAVGILLIINRSVLLSFMNSADENSCYFFAQCLKAGKWWVKPHELKEFFETAHIGAIGDKWFSVYPPGWPLVWAAALKVHLHHAINPILTALSLVFLYDLAKKIYSPEAFFLSAFILLLSPFFLMTGSAYYSHNLCMFLMLAFWSCYFRLKETQGFKWAILAGFILGYAFATRYLTAAALGFLPSLVLGLEGLRKRGKNLSSFLLFSGVFFFMLALQLLYNQFLTGFFLDPPNHYLHSHEKLGFIAGYTPLTALDYLGKRFLYLLDWTPPGWFYLFLSACLIWKPRNQEDLIFRATIFLLPFAYVFYYSWGGNQYGPRYLYESYPMLILTSCAFVVDLLKRSSDLVRKSLLLFFVFSALAAIPILSRHLKFFYEGTYFRKSAYAYAENSVQKPALIFVSGFFGSTSLAMAPEDLVRNSPFLNTSIIYAADKGEENSKLVPFFPRRHYYRLTYDQKSNQSRIEPLAV